MTIFLLSTAWGFVHWQINIVADKIFFLGDGAQVCSLQGDEFFCSTSNGSTNQTCDKDRCPLQGPPMAPKMEPQPTGLPFVFGEKEVKRTMILKLFSNNQIIPAINNERMNHPHPMFTIRVISVCPHLMTKFCKIYLLFCFQ